jgi:hypothetical protein
MSDCSVCGKDLAQKIVPCSRCHKLCHTITCSQEMFPTYHLCNNCSSVEDKNAKEEFRFREIKDLIQKKEDRIAALEQKMKHYEKATKKVKKAGLAYIVLFILVTTIICCLVKYGWAQTPEITIEYNVGEIIIGLLGGVGIATAGIAYAIKSLKNDE